MKKLIYLIPALILILLASCGRGTAPANRYTAYDDMIDHSKSLAFGEDNDVYLFCGSQNLQVLEPLLRSSIERSVGLVYDERYFNLIPVGIDRINELLAYKNLIFVGDLTGQDDISAYMRQSLAEDYITRVQQSGGDLFIAKNKNSRDQLILYLLGADKEKLAEITSMQINNIFSLLLKRYGERLAYQAYRGKVIGADFWSNFPFSMQVPDNYRLYANNVQNRFLSLIYRSRMEDREIPDKYISVYYEDMDSDRVDGDWLFDKRNEIWGQMMEGDEIKRDKIRMERFNFAGYRGWRLIGAWENQPHLIGGAFQSMGFWHPQSQRAYIVDNSVYFPAGDKLSILLELYMISSSLQIKADNTPVATEESSKPQ